MGGEGRRRMNPSTSTPSSLLGSLGAGSPLPKRPAQPDTAPRALTLGAGSRPQGPGEARGRGPRGTAASRPPCPSPPTCGADTVKGPGAGSPPRPQRLRDGGHLLRAVSVEGTLLHRRETGLWAPGTGSSLPAPERHGPRPRTGPRLRGPRRPTCSSAIRLRLAFLTRGLLDASLSATSPVAPSAPETATAPRVRLPPSLLRRRPSAPSLPSSHRGRRFDGGRVKLTGPGLCPQSPAARALRWAELGPSKASGTFKGPRVMLPFHRGCEPQPGARAHETCCGRVGGNEVTAMDAGCPQVGRRNDTFCSAHLRPA